jgi:hypothetical protein
MDAASITRGSPDMRAAWDMQCSLRNRVEECLNVALPLAAQYGLDETPLLWVRRYIRGNTPRDAKTVTAARDLVDRIYVRQFGKKPEFTGIFHEEADLKVDQQPAIAGAGTTDVEAQMRQIAEIVGDQNAGAILTIAQRQDWSADRKMQEILRLDQRFAGKDSNQWAMLLGVTASNIRQTGTWKVLHRTTSDEA